MTVLTLRAALVREQGKAEQLPGSIASAVDVLIDMIDALQRPVAGHSSGHASGESPREA